VKYRQSFTEEGKSSWIKPTATEALMKGKESTIRSLPYIYRRQVYETLLDMQERRKYREEQEHPSYLPTVTRGREHDINSYTSFH
jgi:hypothetical protein